MIAFFASFPALDSLTALWISTDPTLSSADLAGPDSNPPMRTRIPRMIPSLFLTIVLSPFRSEHTADIEFDDIVFLPLFGVQVVTDIDCEGTKGRKPPKPRSRPHLKRSDIAGVVKTFSNVKEECPP